MIYLLLAQISAPTAQKQDQQFFANSAKKRVHVFEIM